MKGWNFGQVSLSRSPVLNCPALPPALKPLAGRSPCTAGGLVPWPCSSLHSGLGGRPEEFVNSAPVRNQDCTQAPVASSPYSKAE